MSAAHNKTHYKKEYPDFMVVVSDSYFKFQKSTNRNLEKFLEEEEIYDEKKRDEISQRNSIRETIKDCFYSHNCFYLPQPFETNRLAELDKINRNEYEKDYSNRLDDLKFELHKIIRPKTINNQSLNGKQLSQYLKMIVEAINDEKVFFIFDAFNKIEANTAKETEEIFENIKKEYKNKMREFMNSSRGPIKRNEFNKNEQRIYGFMREALKEKITKTFIDEYTKKFDTFRKGFDENSKLNEKKIKEHNEKIAFDLWESKIDPNFRPNSITFEDKNEFNRTIDEIKNELKANCFELEGNEFQKFWQDFLIKKNYQIYIDNIRTNNQEVIQIQHDRNFDPRNESPQVGTISIAGEVRPLYEGPRGGLYHYPKSGKPSHVKENHRGITFFQKYKF